MEKKLIFTGKTVEEAIEAGLNELSLSRDEVDVEVLEEGKKRLLGKSAPAEVKLTVKEKKSDGERAVKFLEGLFEVLGLNAVPVLESEEEKIFINLTADDEKNLIGRRGEIIDAIQTLAGAVANTGRREYKRVVVDYEDYRSRREETLKHVAEKLAQKAVRLGKKMRLEPMNPYERRIIHAALMENPDVTTKSEGKEPARFVVIIPKNLRKSDDRNRGKGGRGGKFNRDRGGNRGEKQYPKRELPAEDTPQTSGTSFKSPSSGGYKKGGFSGFFGTYLGNANDGETEENTTTEQPTDEE